jgi:Fuc2NAc and GlcNAc transferase
VISGVWLIVVATFVLSALLTGAVRRVALSRGLLDVPNARSSHETPIPRGGGAAMVLTASAAWITLGLMGVIQAGIVIALSGGGIVIAVVGLLDDRSRLSARLRLSVHFAAALWALLWLKGLPPIRVGEHVIVFGWGGYILGALGIVWTLNLFNFMDGIDGIAASEAIFVVVGGIMLAQVGEGRHAQHAADLVLVAACCGFLLWNWLILGAVFFVDATVTLVRRLLRGERLHEAHRTHAYQWLVRRWGSHRRVTLAVLAVNVLWLLPLAALAVKSPAHAPFIVATALAPLIVLAIAARAGVPES